MEVSTGRLNLGAAEVTVFEPSSFCGIRGSVVTQSATDETAKMALTLCRPNAPVVDRLKLRTKREEKRSGNQAIERTETSYA